MQDALLSLVTQTGVWGLQWREISILHRSFSSSVSMHRQTLESRDRGRGACMQGAGDGD